MSNAGESVPSIRSIHSKRCWCRTSHPIAWPMSQNSFPAFAAPPHLGAELEDRTGDLPHRPQHALQGTHLKICVVGEKRKQVNCGEVFIGILWVGAIVGMVMKKNNVEKKKTWLSDVKWARTQVIQQASWVVLSTDGYGYDWIHNPPVLTPCQNWSVGRRVSTQIWLLGSNS